MDSLNSLVGLIVFVLGCTWIFKELRNPSFGWIGFPVAMIALWVIMDCCVSPFLVTFFDVSWSRSDLVQRSTPEQYLPSVAILLIWYCSIYLGLNLVSRSSSLRPVNLAAPNKPAAMPAMTMDLWNVGLVFLAIGGVFHLILFALLSSDFTMTDISQMRLIHTGQRFVQGQGSLMLFGYVAMFAKIFEIGLVCILVSIKGRQGRLIVAAISACLWLVLLILKGGRQSLILAFLTLGLALHYNVKRLRFGTWLSLGLGCLGCIIVIYAVRFEVAMFYDRLNSFVIDAFADRYLEDVAFVQQIFGQTEPYLWGKSVVQPLISGLMPGVGFEWCQSFYQILNELSGKNYHLSTGVHYSAAAEIYANFGIMGVPLLGILCGIFFGVVFTEVNKRLDNPLVMVYGILALVIFFAGLPTKIFHMIGALGFLTIVPLAFVKIMTQGNIMKQKGFLLSVIFLIGFFFTYKVSESEVLRLSAAVCLSAMTVASFRIVFSGFGGRKRPVPWRPMRLSER